MQWSRPQHEMTKWSRAHHFVEALALAEEAKNDFPNSDRDFKMALAQFHMTAASVGDTAWSGISGHRGVQQRKQGE